MRLRLAHVSCRRATHTAMRRLTRQTRHISTTPSVDSLLAEIERLTHRVQRLEDSLASQKMQYRPLGNTGLEVSIVSLGCAPLGSVYGDMSYDKAQEIIDFAFDNGVNLLDTSPYYGDYTSEIMLGRCLQKHPRESYLLATKVGRYANCPTDFSAATVRRSVEESLQRLGVDYIDVIQCHDVEFASSLDQVLTEALPTLAELRQEGKVRYIGVTGLPLQVVDYVLEHSTVEIDSVLSYCCYTLNNTNLSTYLPRWKHKGYGVIQGGATSMGLLTPQGPQDWHPAPPELRKVCRQAVQHCETKGKSIVELAFKFTLSEDRIASTLVGPIDVAQLSTSLQWMREPLDTKLLDEVLDILAPIANKVWVEQGSEEAIALAYGGYWAKGNQKSTKVITGDSRNLSS